MSVSNQKRKKNLKSLKIFHILTIRIKKKLSSNMFEHHC